MTKINIIPKPIQVFSRNKKTILTLNYVKYQYKICDARHHNQIYIKSSGQHSGSETNFNVVFHAYLIYNIYSSEILVQNAAIKKFCKHWQLHETM